MVRIPLFFFSPRDGGGGGGGEDTRGGGEGVRGEREEICDIKHPSSIWHHPNDVGGACETNYIH